MSGTSTAGEADALVAMVAPQAPAYLAEDFAQGAAHLLPRGPAWPRSPGSVLQRLLAALAPAYARSAARAAALLADSPAGQLTELLPEWEAALGLPDPCAGEAPTVQQRRAQVAARLTGRGGQSVPYLTAYAAALGYQVTVQEYAPSRFGRPFGGRFGGEAWAHAWQVTAPAFTRRMFQFGQGRFGEPFSSWGGQVLECELRRIAPAHTTLRFSYAGSPAAALWDAPGGWDVGGWAA